MQGANAILYYRVDASVIDSDVVPEDVAFKEQHHGNRIP
jgi:hypothetical protein